MENAGSFSACRGTRNRGIWAAATEDSQGLEGFAISVRSGQEKTLFWIQRLLEVGEDGDTHLNAMLK